MSGVRHLGLALVLACGLMASGCTGDAKLPTFDEPVKGDRVDPSSFLAALRGSFRVGSTAAVRFEVRGDTVVSGGGSVRYGAEDIDAHLKLGDWKVDGGAIDIVTVGGTTYMRVPESRGLWVNVSEGGAGLPGADLAQDADPRRELKELESGLTEVRFSGTETVNGVRARRFQVIAESADGAVPAVTQYWFDRRDRVVRRQSELSDGGGATFTWAQWGKPVTIVRPKASRVVTLAELERARKDQLP
jgi:hypothetical protein